MKNKINLLAKGSLCAAMLMSTASWADGGRMYEVSITNLMPGQPLAPLMVVTHRAGMSFFTPGEAPIAELANLAEAGDGHPVADKLAVMSKVTATVVGDAGTPPAGSSSVVIKAQKQDHLSLGAMLGNTNDAFAGLRDVDLPDGRQTVTYMAAAYDAGTETNDESCATVPGPACGGEALSPNDDGEGFVYVHNGIHGIGGLTAAEYDWRNPVAMIVIKRMD